MDCTLYPGFYCTLYSEILNWKEKDPLCKDYAWYNILMYYAISRAKRKGFLKEIKKPNWKNCHLCNHRFLENSLPYPLIQKIGIHNIDFCSPCHVDVNSIQCLFCGNYNTKKWDPTIGLCPKCGSTMTFKTQGEIRVKPLEVKKVIKEKPIKAKEIKSVEDVYKNGLFTINGIDKDNNLYPITHKDDPARVGKLMTDEELHAFAVQLVLVYYHYNHGYIKSRNINPGIEYPHIVMRNKDTEKLYYLIVKAGIHPEIPEPLPTGNYSTVIKLAEEAKAIPVFIGVVFSNYSTDDDSLPICGGDYIVKITRLKKL